MARRSDETDGWCRASWDLVPVPVTGRQGTAVPVTREIGRPRGRPGPADACVSAPLRSGAGDDPHPSGSSPRATPIRARAEGSLGAEAGTPASLSRRNCSHTSLCG
ncbi:hypothetical protein GCM10018777_26450 [Streptomyces albogriseolus]|nr:hypothetical protein GCM10018777_26450 [Streptomyces viridodiastaticus]